MKWLARWLIRITLVAAAAMTALWFFGPEEPVDFSYRFDPGIIGDDPVRYLAGREAAFIDITPGAEKRIDWAVGPGVRTDLVLVYLHGFSATSRETHPMTDLVADRLSANVVYTRLAGHGRSGAAMAEPSVADWIADVDEALAVAERIGDRIVIIGVSTGATLAAAVLQDGRDAPIAGTAMISPNFRIKNPLAAVLTIPGARYWLPPLFGEERSFEALNDDHAKWWTTRYPTVSVLPMAAMVRTVRDADFSGVATPLLVVLADTDQVVDAATTRQVASGWGAPVTIADILPGAGDDPFHHVIAGDALSPGLTARVAGVIADWAEGL